MPQLKRQLSTYTHKQVVPLHNIMAHFSNTALSYLLTWILIPDLMVDGALQNPSARRIPGPAPAVATDSTPRRHCKRWHYENFIGIY